MLALSVFGGAVIALCNDDVTDPATDVDVLEFELDEMELDVIEYAFDVDEIEPVVEPVAGSVTESFVESATDSDANPLDCDELPHEFGYPASRF